MDRLSIIQQTLLEAKRMKMSDKTLYQIDNLMSNIINGIKEQRDKQVDDDYQEIGEISYNVYDQDQPETAIVFVGYFSGDHPYAEIKGIFVPKGTLKNITENYIILNAVNLDPDEELIKNAFTHEIFHAQDPIQTTHYKKPKISNGDEYQKYFKSQSEVNAFVNTFLQFIVNQSKKITNKYPDKIDFLKTSVLNIINYFGKNEELTTSTRQFLSSGLKYIENVAPEIITNRIDSLLLPIQHIKIVNPKEYKKFLGKLYSTYQEIEDTIKQTTEVSEDIEILKSQSSLGHQSEDGTDIPELNEGLNLPKKPKIVIKQKGNVFTSDKFTFIYYGPDLTDQGILYHGRAVYNDESFNGVIFVSNIETNFSYNGYALENDNDTPLYDVLPVELFKEFADFIEETARIIYYQNKSINEGLNLRKKPKVKNENIFTSDKFSFNYINTTDIEGYNKFMYDGYLDVFGNEFYGSIIMNVENQELNYEGYNFEDTMTGDDLSDVIVEYEDELNEFLEDVAKKIFFGIELVSEGLNLPKKSKLYAELRYRDGANNKSYFAAEVPPDLRDEIEVEFEYEIEDFHINADDMYDAFGITYDNSFDHNYVEVVGLVNELPDNMIYISPSDYLKEEVMNIDSPITEGMFKCTIEDVEKRAKKIIFSEYNWNPKNVTFDQSNDMITTTIKFDNDEQWKSQKDDQIFSYLKRVAEDYESKFKREFNNFCSSGLKFLGKKTTLVNVGTYVYTVMERYYLNPNDKNTGTKAVTVFDSDGNKRKIKHGNNINYQLGKFYIQIGLSVNNPVQ
jgi:hypothetical protein